MEKIRILKMNYLPLVFPLTNQIHNAGMNNIKIFFLIGLMFCMKSEAKVPAHQTLLTFHL